MSIKPKRTSMITQIAILFVFGVILTGTISSAVIYSLSYQDVQEDMIDPVVSTASMLKDYLDEFETHEWLYEYWYNHYGELNIEYDAGMSSSTATARKNKLLIQRHPEFDIDYATVEEVEALPAEDQKIYAEIIYTWVTNRIDQIVVNYDYDYLFCFLTEEPYDEGFLLLIASKDENERGEEHGIINPIGKTVYATAEQKEAIANSVHGEYQTALSQDGAYMHFYFPLSSIGDKQLLIGLTHNTASLKTMAWNHALSHSGFTMLFLIILAVVCLMTMLTVILDPIKKIQTSIRNYKENKDSEQVEKELKLVHSGNELEDLSQDVVDLSKEMEEYTRKIVQITLENERIETELSLASKIQASVLPQEFPRYPDRHDFDVYGSMDPAKEVGGDFYDFFLLDDHYLCMIIGDVSGKGIPAALFMMASAITLSHNVKLGKSPAEVLAATNESICSRNPEKMFVTVWIGILDLDTGILKAANGGHEFPILKEADGYYELYQDPHSFVIGGMEDVPYKEYEIQMKPGAKLFLYTDGLTEAIDESETMFGADRIIKQLNQNPDESAKDTIIHMKDAVEAFIKKQEQFDDLTMLCLSYNGPSEQTKSQDSADSTDC